VPSNTKRVEDKLVVKNLLATPGTPYGVGFDMAIIEEMLPKVEFFQWGTYFGWEGFSDSQILVVGAFYDCYGVALVS
jgi:hypothetical protein